MGIKIYLSFTSGNKEIKMKQDFVRHVLECKKIVFEEIDISDPSNEEQKLFMRQSAKAREGQNVPLPPQVYNDDQYLGDYDAFLEANECDELYEFLKFAPAKATSEAAVTLSEPTPEPKPAMVTDHLGNRVIQSKITITLANTNGEQ